MASPVAHLSSMAILKLAFNSKVHDPSAVLGEFSSNGFPTRRPPPTGSTKMFITHFSDIFHIDIGLRGSFKDLPYFLRLPNRSTTQAHLAAIVFRSLI